MHFCFIIEAQYRHELIPMAVARQLVQWGHDVVLKMDSNRQMQY
jgi:hypothetical protein